jgi:hypothetical protein
MARAGFRLPDATGIFPLSASCCRTNRAAADKRGLMKTLHAKFFLLVAVLVCANGGLALFLQERMFRVFEMTMTQALNATLAQTVAAELPSTSLDPEMVAGVKSEFSKLMSINPLIEIYLLDREGRVKTFTAPPEEVRREKVDLKPLKNFIANHFVFPIVGDDPRIRVSGKSFLRPWLIRKSPSAPSSTSFLAERNTTWSHDGWKVYGCFATC